jgi:cysteine desulfuration protein SufE
LAGAAGLSQRISNSGLRAEAASAPCPMALAAFFFSLAAKRVMPAAAPPYMDGMTQTVRADTMSIDDIIENFALLDEWDDRYRYLIELGRGLAPLPDAERNEGNKVQGCASQVWLATSAAPDGAGGPVLTFVGDSDAHIVRGLIAVLLTLNSGKTAREILRTDAVALFEQLGLREHLTPQRSNGFRSMVERIRSDANAALAAAA